MAAAVREVEQDVEGVGRLAALGVKRVVVVGASIKMQGSLLCMCKRLVELADGRQHRLQCHAQSEQHQKSCSKQMRMSGSAGHRDTLPMQTTGHNFIAGNRKRHSEA